MKLNGHKIIHYFISTEKNAATIQVFIFTILFIKYKNMFEKNKLIGILNNLKILLCSMF